MVDVRIFITHWQCASRCAIIFNLSPPLFNLKQLLQNRHTQKTLDVLLLNVMRLFRGSDHFGDVTSLIFFSSARSKFY